MKLFFALIAASMLSLTALLPSGMAALRFDPLPYEYDALEPHIDSQTMDIHYSRHHWGYFNNLLKALEGTSLANSSLEEILSEVSQWPEELRNNAGGHYNHDLFWKILSPEGGGEPQGELAEHIDAAFGSFAQFKKAFTEAALARFGSGWAWLCVADDGSLFVASTANQDNPLMDISARRGIPILGLDVWEHAYYLQYQNRRGSYIEAFWNVVNWPEVSARFKKARASLF